MKIIMYVTNSIFYTIITALLFFGCSSSKDVQRPSEEQRFEMTSSTLVNLGNVNSPEDDFAPWLSPEGNALYLTSNKKYLSTDRFIDNASKYGEHIYVCDGQGVDWQLPARVQGLGETQFNTGTFALSRDGKTAYFSSSYRNDGVGGTDVYRTRFAGAQWGVVECMKPVNSKYWDGHACVSVDGKELVFATDREAASSNVNGAKDQSHLWISRMNTSNDWDPPVKLPFPINSSYSEMSPSFGPDGYLYFATNRFPNRGFDIVRSKETNGVWSEPEVLGAPVNSAYDDCFPFITNNREKVYFASNRPGGKGGLDIYEAGFPYRIRLNGTISLSNEKGIAVTVGAFIPVMVENTKTKEVQKIETNAEGKYEAVLSPNAEYRITTGNADCYALLKPDLLRVGVPAKIDTVITRDYILPRVVFPKFELGRFNIPFFVTGYYIPNTPENLVLLHKRIANKELDIAAGGRTPYIDPDDEKYQSYSDSIKSIFESVYNKIERDILPLFNKCAYSQERLKIEVKGFVDPRGLTYGVYVDDTIMTDSMRVERGTVMQGQTGNTKLANLRAYYTLKMIDDEMQNRSQTYRDLKAANRIHTSAYGVGIDVSKNPNLMQDPAKRRIDITLTIEKPR